MSSQPQQAAPPAAAEAAASYPMISTRDMEEHYEKVEKIGEGTYGEVHVAKSRANPEEQVALKKIKLDSDSDSRRGGFPITAIREIKILKALDDDNVVRLKDMVVTREDPENEGRDSVYMVFEYLDHDLDGLMGARAGAGGAAGGENRRRPQRR